MRNDNWYQFVKHLHEMNENEVRDMLSAERKRKPPRPSYLHKLHRRYTRLRYRRERQEMGLEEV